MTMGHAAYLQGRPSEMDMKPRATSAWKRVMARILRFTRGFSRLLGFDLREVELVDDDVLGTIWLTKSNTI